MPRPRSTCSNLFGADENPPFFALRQLARPHAVARARDDGLEVEVIGPRATNSVASTVIAKSTWSLMMQRGWVVPNETSEDWRISNAGRIALKRAISRAGAPEAGEMGASREGGIQVRRHTSPSVPGQNGCESPLQWLSRRRDRQGRPLISEAQFDAGERLRADFTYGSMMPSVTSRWTPVAAGTSPGTRADRELELQDGQLRARERFRSALAAVGPEFSSILVDVCCHLKGLEEIERHSGWPQRSAKIVLLLALSALARHYGFVPSSRA
jgi:Domain of unknown function (DUF6456)